MKEKEKKVDRIYRLAGATDLKAWGYCVPPDAVKRAIPELAPQPMQRYLLNIMVDHLFSLRGIIPPTRELAKKLGVCYRQTQRWLKSLVDLELLKIELHPGKISTFDLSPLLNAVRDLFRHKRRKSVEPEPEPVVPEDDPDMLYQPLNPEQHELAEELAEAGWPESDMAEWGYAPGWRHLDSMSSWRQVLHVFDSGQIAAIRKWLTKLRRGLVLMVAALPGGA